jgi:hypothetical protein
LRNNILLEVSHLLAGAVLWQNVRPALTRPAGPVVR